MSDGADKSLQKAMPSRAWSLETLRGGLDTVELQHVKEEVIDRDIKDCMACCVRLV